MSKFIQFIAGAVCPSCKAQDTIAINPDDDLIYCVKCDFKENRPEEITRIIENFPLAMLVVNSKNGFIANHLPLLVNKSSKKEIELIGHIARANSLYKEIDNNDDVLVIFRSEDAYISPNWYPSRKNREHVPTWNYQAVHLHGNITFSKEKKISFKTENVDYWF